MDLNRTATTCRFNVIVRTRACTYAYIAINTCSADVINDAIDRFGPCYVSVRAKQ